MKKRKKLRLKKQAKRGLIVVLAIFVLGGIYFNSASFDVRKNEAYSSLNEQYQKKQSVVEEAKIKEETKEEIITDTKEDSEVKVETNETAKEDRNNEEIIWDYLTDNGFTEIQAAAIIGNMYQESRLDPSKVESNGIGIGLIQWSYGRREQLESYASNLGKDWTDINVQLEFFLNEWKEGKQIWGSNKEKFDNPYSVDEATEAFCFGFERPDKDSANLKYRKSQAWATYYRNEGR